MAEKKTSNAVKKPLSKGWNIRRQLSGFRHAGMGSMSSLSRFFIRDLNTPSSAPDIHGIIWRQ